MGALRVGRGREGGEGAGCEGEPRYLTLSILVCALSFASLGGGSALILPARTQPSSSRLERPAGGGQVDGWADGLVGGVLVVGGLVDNFRRNYCVRSSLVVGVRFTGSASVLFGMRCSGQTTKAQSA